MARLRRPPTMMTCLSWLQPFRSVATAATIRNDEIPTLDSETSSIHARAPVRPVVPLRTLLEEEKLPGYHPLRYYPAHIGDTLNGRYQFVGKLGYGGSSTVWLCRDVKSSSYRVVKICTTDASERIRRGRSQEIQVLQHLRDVRYKHPCSDDVRSLEDTFTVTSPLGSKHVCLLHQPLGSSLLEVQTAFGGRLPLPLVKSVVLRILLGLSFLHDEARVVHTDLQNTNIIFGLKDDTPLRQFEEAEQLRPSPRKTDGSAVIYKSRVLKISNASLHLPQITDFGEARLGLGPHTGDVMPELFRAPEIILQAPWNEKIDIWNVGVLMWHILEGKSLFHARDIEGDLNNWCHLHEMIALFGPPPTQLIRAGIAGAEYFEPDGTLKAGYAPSTSTLETEGQHLQGDEKVEFLRFLRRMLQWDPAMRPSAEELAMDDFLLGHLNDNP